MELIELWKPLKYYSSRIGKITTYDFIEVSYSGKFRYADSKRNIRVSFSAAPPYPTITIQRNSESVKIRLLVHVAVLTTFSTSLPTTQGIVVDHIDRIKTNYSINNLRFVSPKENNKNREFPKNLFNAVLVDSETKEIISILKNYTKRSIRKFNNFDKHKYEMFYFTNDVLNLIESEKITFHILNEITWVRISSIFEISSFGILRKKKKLGYFYTLGTVNNSGYFRITLDNGKQRLVHSLVAREFINGGKEIDSKFVIDHIDTNRKNNSVDNLRIVSPSENMSNPLSVQKASNLVGCNNLGQLIYFKSQLDCSRILGVSPALVSKCTSKGKSLKPYLTPLVRLSSEESLEGYKLITKFEELKLS